MNPHFASLVLGLAHQADAALQGQLPPGAEAAGAKDPRQIAQALIDTLVVLEEKTVGNLEAEEKRLLTEALNGLRFRFVTTAPSRRKGSPRRWIPGLRGACKRRT